MAENDRAQILESNIRRVGRQIAIGSAAGGQALSELHLDIAELTARQDPDRIDHTSADYAAGAAAMAATILNGLYEQVIPPVLLSDSPDYQA